MNTDVLGFDRVVIASLALSLLLICPGFIEAQERLSERPASPRQGASHPVPPQGKALVDLSFEEWLEAADLVAFGRILAPPPESEARDLDRVHAFQLLKVLKDDGGFESAGGQEPATVFESDSGYETPFLLENEHYVLLLRRRSPLGEYEILGSSTVNLHIDHRLRTPSGETLTALTERISTALGLPLPDPAEDEAAEAALPAGVPLSASAPDNDPAKAPRGAEGAAKGVGPPAAIQQILYEDFEGVFPGAWSVFDNNGATGGNVYWDDTSFRSFAGSWSGGCADGGSNASPPGTNYPNDMDSWLMYGPFDLSDAIGGTFSFRFWNDSELNFDFFKYLVSVDGFNFYGFQNSGNTGGWASRSLDLTNVPTLGDVTGDSSVWIAFVFTSDFSITAEGAYVDEVRVEKTTSAAADLELQLVDAPAGTFASGDSITIHNITENIGGLTSDPYRITFYASTNTTISTADTAIGFVDRSALAPGGVHNFNTTGALPSLADGTYYIGAILTVSDGSSSNNTNFDSVPITIANGSPADLELQLVDAPSGTFAPGDSITIHNITENIGGLTSDPYRITFYASTNTIISTADAEIGFVDRAALASGAVHNFNTTGPLPSLADGDYYIGAILTVSDASSANNVNHDSVPLTVSSGGGGTPDIRISPTTLNFASPSPAPPPAAGTKSAGLLSRLAAKAHERGHVRVIVGFDVAFVPEGRQPGRSAVEAQRLRIAEQQDTLLARLGGTDATVTARYRSIPFLALEVDEHALAELGRIPDVTSIEEDVAHPPLMASSNPVIGSPDAWAQGFTGAGQNVAVLDTGVDKNHPFFTTGGATVMSEACYSTTSAANSSTSLCPGGASSSTASGSGLNCSTAITGCDHGTHVAGTVAGNDGVGPNFGVGRDAGIVAIQVFSEFNDSGICGLVVPCVLSYTSDQIKALERVLALSGSMDIAAVNMSLGGGRYFSSATCDAANASQKAAIDNLRSVDIATVIAAGNDGFTDSMGAPGCISSAVSVGATTDSDDVASFSNIASFLDLLAPGVFIDSSVPGGGIGNKSGTSMATPHVAGAWAVLKQASPSASVDDVLAALRSTGTSIDDDRFGGTVNDLRRINVDQALSVLGGSGSSQPFTIFNDGSATLSVTSIALQTTAPWIQWSPAAPFTVAPGGSQSVFVTVDFSLAPEGTSTRRIVVQSDDSDESPYPGAVDVVVDNVQEGSLIFSDGFESGNVSTWSSSRN